jgi:hypothetical protein
MNGVKEESSHMLITAMHSATDLVSLSVLIAVRSRTFLSTSSDGFVGIPKH